MAIPQLESLDMLLPARRLLLLTKREEYNK
jgi:hypothetical protein